MSDDYTQDTTTTGSIAVGGTATGEIGSSGDRDWFAVDLVAGRTYVIDLRGRPTDDGTLSDTYLRGIHDAHGNLISGTTNDDGGEGYNSQLTFTARETGTHYIAAGAYGNRQGTYELEITEKVSDDTQDGAKDLGDITDLDGPRFPNASLDGDGDRIDYFQFTLTEAKEVGLGLRQQDADADLFLEDAEGNVLYSSTEDGTANEAIYETLLAGTYYVRVETQEEGDNDFRLRYGVSAPDPDEVARLEQQRQGRTNEAPAFTQQSYTFGVAENADGSTNRVALGAVSATDPENSAIAYSIEGGNSAGLFEIDASTGTLSYRGTGEDYESGTTGYELTVRASDGDLHSDVIVTVNVADMQEAPAFAEPSYTFDLAENADGSTNRVALGTLSATDPEDATLTFSIEGGNAAGLFEIDASTGALSYKGTGEDYESGTTSYELTVRASDGGLHSDVTVTVNVTDVEEQTEPDQLISQEQQAAVQETVSEPDGEDFSADNASQGRVAVGGTATGEIGSSGDRDWFAVDLVAGRTYVIDLRGRPTDDGTLSDTYLRGIHDAHGNLVSGTRNDDGGTGYNSRLTFTASESGTYYIAAGAFGSRQGTYEVEVTDTAADDERDGARDLGDIAGLDGPRFRGASLDGDGDRIDYFRFTLTEAKEVGLGLRQQDADADLFLEDAEGNVLYSSTTDGTANEAINETLLVGTYYIRVEAQEAGDNEFRLRYGVSAPDADEVARLEQQQQGGTNEAPAFGRQSYAFDLAENADGSTNRVALGTLSATDPEDATLTFSIEGGNSADLFEIDASTGALSYKGAGEDYESGTTSYELTVRASDGSLHSDVMVTVNVTDVEETAQQSLPSVSEPDGSDLPEDTSTIGRVAVGGIATGEIHSARDRDWFAVELEAGKAYQIDPSGARSGGGTLNLPHLHGVYDAEGSQIPGVYHPLSFWGFQNPHNRLIEGISSVDIQTFRGEDGQAFFTPDEDGTYYLELGNFDFSSTGTYTVGVTEIEDDFLRTVDTTGTVEIGSTATGEIQYPNDRDWFAVELSAGVTYKVELLGEDDNGGTLQHPYIRGIRDADGRQVSDTTYYATDPYRYSQSEYETYPHSNSELIFKPDADGTYYVAAGSYMTGIREEDVGTYTLKVSIDDTRVDPTGTSEPAGGDLAADTSTIGRLAVGGSAFGEIGNTGDRDWFAVELEAGETYRINTDGRQSGGGTLPRGRLYNIYDAVGNAIPGVDDEPITWLPIHYPSPRQVRNMDGLAFFTPDQDGTYYLEVGSGSFETAFSATTGTGSYTVRVAEMEDDFSASTDTTGTVEVGGTATGESQYEIDRDWFAVELTAGETYKVELLGARAKGGTLHQPYIWGIHDANGDLISGTSDYASGPHSNSQVFFTPDEDGTYYVAAGNHESGSLSNDVGTYTVQVSIDDFTDDIDTTGTLEVGGSVTGEIEAQGDRDWFAVTLEAGKTYQIDMEGSATDGGTLDNPTLYPLRDANGSILQFVGFDRDSGEGFNSRATFTVEEDGTYYVVALSGGHMHADDSHGRSIGTYTLSFEEVVDPIVEPVVEAI